MKPGYRKFPLLLLAVSCLALSPISRAEIILQTVSLGTNSTVAPGVSIGLHRFTPFDPALGTLNSVEIELFGSLFIELQVFPFAPDPRAGPIPQIVTAEFTQNLNGLIAGDFDFLLAPSVLVNHVALAEAFTSTVNFNYRFRFDELADQLGFATVSGFGTPVGSLSTVVSGTPSLAFGSRDAFIDSLGGGVGYYQNSWTSSYSTTGLFSPPTFSYSGLMWITYDYSPFSEPPDQPQPVPEPGTFAIFAVGLVALVGRRRAVSRQNTRNQQVQKLL